MSEIQSLAAPKASFDRRTVVKTAAWSVPVIAAAIAAPAAAASAPASAPTATATGTVTATLTLGAVDYLGKPLKHGNGPRGFTISNTTAADASVGSVVITIAPVAGNPYKIGVTSLSGADISGVESWTATNVYSVTYNFTNSVVTKGSTRTFDFVYHHLSQNKDAGKYVLDIRILGATGADLTTSAELTLVKGAV